jgi:hypothetical protein
MGEGPEGEGVKYLTDFPPAVQKFLKKHRSLRRYLGYVNFEILELRDENKRLKETIKKKGRWIELKTEFLEKRD